MIFVDASALVALIAVEPDFVDLADRLERYETRLCSAMTLWETAAALCRNYGMSVAGARVEVEDFRLNLRLTLVEIGEAEGAMALLAYEKFGKGRHPAGLNMGDCFAYACARSNGAKLLFKGGDFGLTDIVAG